MTRRYWTSLISSVAIGIATCGAAPLAKADVLYSTSGADLTSLGDTLGSPFDQLQLLPFSGTVNNSLIKLNSFIFTVGFNANAPEIPPPSSLPILSETLTFNGVTSTIFIPYSIQINNSDTLNIATGQYQLTFPGFNAPLYFIPKGGQINADYVLTLVPGSFTAFIGPNGTPGQFAGDLYAQITPIPEPATWALLIVGFAGMGLVTYRRRTALAAG